MRKKLYDDVCGLYEPAFLRIDICEEFNFDAWDNNSPHQKAVFLHEYIHYLQDISTGFGLRNFSTVAKELQGFIYKASHEHNVIHIPISLSDMDYAEENLLQREIYLGDHEFQKNKKIHDIVMRPNEFMLEMNEKIALNDQEIILIDERNQEYRLGGMCVMESMAHLIERTIYPAEKMNNCFPYNTCEMVARKIYPEIVSENSFLIALCDAVLLSVHPGLTFYLVLTNMNKVGFQPKSVDDIYRFVYSYPAEWLYEQSYEEALEMMEYLYPAGAGNTKKINLWIKGRFQIARKKRTERPSFITDLANLKDTRRAEFYFLQLLNQFEIPLLTHNDSIYVPRRLNDDVGIVQLFGPLTLRKLFSGQSHDDECEMYQYCKAQNFEKDYCKNAPWMAAEECEPCPIGQLLYRFGLEGKSFQKRY